MIRALLSQYSYLYGRFIIFLGDKDFTVKTKETHAFNQITQA